MDSFLSVSRKRISIGMSVAPVAAHFVTVIARPYADSVFENKIAHITTMYFVCYFYHFAEGSPSES